VSLCGSFQAAAKSIALMKVSIFTDEICKEDPERALRLAAGWGLTHVEVSAHRPALITVQAAWVHATTKFSTRSGL
jgi:hypothetical protein